MVVVDSMGFCRLVDAERNRDGLEKMAESGGEKERG